MNEKMNTGEIGTCEVCGTENVSLSRKTYRYDIDCWCCSSGHFEVVRYCNDCRPLEPTEITVLFNTKK